MGPRWPGSRKAKGTVLAWYPADGWGMLVGPKVHGTVFAHRLVVDIPSHVELWPGQRVEFEYTTPGSNGCDHTATYVRRL
jgi:cold shock CspA family protein